MKVLSTKFIFDLKVGGEEKFMPNIYHMDNIVEFPQHSNEQWAKEQQLLFVSLVLEANIYVLNI